MKYHQWRRNIKGGSRGFLDKRRVVDDCLTVDYRKIAGGGYLVAWLGQVVQEDGILGQQADSGVAPGSSNRVPVFDVDPGGLSLCSRHANICHNRWDQLDKCALRLILERARASTDRREEGESHVIQDV